MGADLNNLVRVASQEAARLHRQGVPRSQAIRAAAQAVRRCVPLPSRRLAVGVGQDEPASELISCAPRPDLPAAVFIGIGAVVSATGHPALGGAMTGIGICYHLAKG